MAKSRNASAQPPIDLSTWQCLAIIAGLAILFFRDHLLGNVYLWEDFLFYSYPVRNFAATSLAAGEFPLWNPYTFNGMPFFADIQTTVLYLPCLLLTLFVKNGVLNYYWLQLVIILHYVLAGVTMFFLARSYKLNAIPSLFAAVSFMLSGFMILHAIHQQIVTMVAWWPLILLLFRKALTEKSWLWTFLTAVVFGHSILAGFPQLTLYFLLFLLAYFLFELLGSHKAKELLAKPAMLMCIRGGAIVALALGLTAVQLLPTQELSGVSQRAAITYEKATEGQMSWSHLITLAFPKFFGEAPAQRTSQYWGPGVFWYYWEDCLYRGALPLILGLLSLLLWKKHRIIPFLWGASVFAVLFSVGSGFFLHKFFYDVVPVFSTFRAPARMMVFMSLAFSLLSAFVIHHLMHEERTRPASFWRNILLAVTACMAALWGMITGGTLSGTFPFLNTQAIALRVNQEANISMFFILLSAALVLGFIVRGSWTKWIGILSVTVLFFDLMVFGVKQNASLNNPTTYFDRSDALVSRLKSEMNNEFFRVNTRNERGMIMDRNQGMIDRIFSLEGYTPLALQWVYAPFTNGDRSHDLLNVKYKTVTGPDQQSLSLQPRTTQMPRAFMVYHLQRVEGEEAMKAYLNSDAFDYRTTAVIEEQPPASFEPANENTRWKAEITSFRQNEIDLSVETLQDGFLVLSEIYYKGWNAYVDGVQQHIYKTDYNLRGIVVNKGNHVVSFRFEPESVRYGAIISIATLLLCIGGIAVPLIRRKPKPS